MALFLRTDGGKRARCSVAGSSRRQHQASLSLRARAYTARGAAQLARACALLLTAACSSGVHPSASFARIALPKSSVSAASAISISRIT